MILRGILDRSLSNQLCIRGFASIKQIAEISKADYSYQRDLYGEQEDIVKRFLETETYLFFPEVILSYKFKHKGDSNDNPFRKIKDFEREEGKTLKAKSNIDNTQITIKKLPYNSSDTRGKASIQAVELELDDNNLRALIENENQPFHRIDGNHRLTVAKNSNSPIVQNMTIPFCVILGEEYYSDDNNVIKNEDSKEYDKSIRVYFHNINTKTLPLSSEQNLKVLIDDDSNFSEKELEKLFPKSGIQIREFVSRVDVDIFNGIEKILEDNLRNVLNTIFKLLSNNNSNKSHVNEVIEAFKAIEQLYIKDKRFKDNENESLFISLIYYHVKNKLQFESYLKWVTNNHLFEVEEERAESIYNTYRKAESIINIYDKIYEKKVYKIFVAMPYYSHSEINEYNKLYKEICNDVSRKAGVELELIPIMRFRGKSQRIDQRLLNKINECDIFIADITENNINVIFEIGYAESRNLPMIILKNESDKTIVPFDMDKLQYLPYPDKGYYNDIKLKVSGNLSEILKKDFNIIF